MGEVFGVQHFLHLQHTCTPVPPVVPRCVCGGGGRGTVLCRPGEGCGKSDGNWMMVVGGGGGGVGDWDELGSSGFFPQCVHLFNLSLYFLHFLWFLLVCRPLI